MPNQSMPIGLSSNEPRLRHRQVKSAPGTVGWMTFTFCWIVAIILLQPPRVDQAEDRDQQRAEPDQEELEHLVEHGGNQPAQGHVDGHGERGHPDADVHVPAQQQVQDLRHGEHAGAADQTVMQAKEMPAIERLPSP